MDGHAACDPALRTNIGRPSARVIALTENDQFPDTIDRQEPSGGAQRPYRTKAQLAGRHGALQPFGNRKAVTWAIELDGAAGNSAKHLALGLWPALRPIKSNPMYRRDRVVDDRREGRDQARDKFIAP
jgi:hypothetical protein